MVDILDIILLAIFWSADVLLFTSSIGIYDMFTWIL